jgi:hypothetical protein
MPIVGGVAVLTAGAILTFALTGSVRGIDLPVVGAILMAAGAGMLLLPMVMRGREVPEQWAARSRQDVIDDGDIDQERTHAEPAAPGRDHMLSGDRRTRDGGRRGARRARWDRR